MKTLNKVSGEFQQVFMPDGSDSIVVASGAQSAVINATWNETVIISAIGDTYVKVGTNPTASEDDIFMKEGEKIPLTIQKGFKISTFGASINITK